MAANSAAEFLSGGFSAGTKIRRIRLMAAVSRSNFAAFMFTVFSQLNNYTQMLNDVNIFSQRSNKTSQQLPESTVLILIMTLFIYNVATEVLHM